MINFGWRQLRHFVAIAEAGTFREAAEKTFTAQPALTVSIRKLEASLGVQLFERGARGVTLTVAGSAFLADARRTFLHAEQGSQDVRLAALGELGLVRLGFVGSAVDHLLPSRLPAFIERYSGMRLSLQESTTVEAVDLLADVEAANGERYRFPMVPSAPPRLGADTAAVLGTLPLDPAWLQRLVHSVPGPGASTPVVAEPLR